MLLLVLLVMLVPTGTAVTVVAALADPLQAGSGGRSADSINREHETTTQQKGAVESELLCVILSGAEEREDKKVIEGVACDINIVLISASGVFDFGLTAA